MERNKLYGGSVTLVYDDKRHIYTVDGKPVPNVTSITGVIAKPALVGWAAKVTAEYIKTAVKPNTRYTQKQIIAIAEEAKAARWKVTKKATNIGLDAHNWVEAYIKSIINKLTPPPPPEHPAVKRAVNAFLDWEKVHKVVYYFSERKVYSDKFGYAGTVDIVGDVNSELSVVDIKTSSGIYEEYFLQAAAYAIALEEELSTTFSKVGVLRIPKDGSDMEYQTREDIQELFRVFASALEIWKWQNT